MAHRCAVVISDVEPLPEVVPEGVAGFTVPTGDVEALVRKLEALIEDQGLLRRMQERAYEAYLQRHHPDVVAKRLREVFEQVLQDH